MDRGELSVFLCYECNGVEYDDVGVHSFVLCAVVCANSFACLLLMSFRTGLEITNFIEEHYGDLVSSKTKTWKNSVMGYDHSA